MPINWTLANKLIKNKTKEIIDELATKLKERVEERTPIGNPSLWHYPAPAGYTPGTLKASWVINKTDLGFSLSNDTPYAQRVEYGWSSQAPNGMLRLTMKDAPQILKQIVRENKL
jgi:hypothetical protein